MTYQDRGAEPRLFGHWIDGRETPSGSGETIDSAATSIAAGTAADMERACEAAARAAKSWGALAPLDRSRALHRLANAMRDAAPQVAGLEAAETGKPEFQAAFEAEGVAEFLEYYAGILRARHGMTVDMGADQRVMSDRVPFGVIGVIAPWNASVYTAIRGAAPALAAGNAVVIKPSEFTSASTLALARIATEIGLPDGLINVVTGTGPAVGEALVTDPRVGKISFTGSVATGRRVAELAGRHLKPVVLELGGKSPNIVFADADLDAAAQGAIAGFTLNSGQICAAGSRILVERSVVEPFVARMKEILDAPQPPAVPIITAPQFDKVQSYIDLATSEGARAVTGGSVATETRHVAPTIYVDVSNDMRIAREEIFGPVAVVIPFDDEAHAIEIANDSEFGLISALWSRDIDRAFRVASALETGQVYVNQFLTPDVEVPFGGMKNSGYGREKGIAAMDEFSRIKSVLIKVGGVA